MCTRKGTEGSNPSLSAIFGGPPKMMAPRSVGQERNDEEGIWTNRRASGGLGRSPERSESIPPSPPAFAPVELRMARQDEETADLIQQHGGAKDGALRSLSDLRRLGEGGHYARH